MENLQKYLRAVHDLLLRFCSQYFLGVGFRIFFFLGNLTEDLKKKRR